MDGWMWAAVIVCAVTALTLLIRAHIRENHQLIAMRRMRGSSLYADLYGMVDSIRGREIEEIRVQRGKVSFFGIYPPGRIGEFDFAQHGHSYLNDERVYALVQVLAFDIPQLQSARDYKLEKFRLERPNGIKDDAYAFIVRPEYKKKVMASHSRISTDRLY